MGKTTSHALPSPVPALRRVEEEAVRERRNRSKWERGVEERDVEGVGLREKRRGKDETSRTPKKREWKATT
jgi:hypothetical protein